jgi:hypothetical protein
MMRLKYLIVIIALVSLFQACKKEEAFEDPYADGKKPLGIQFSRTLPPSPSEALPGSIVSFSATGLMPYKDQLSFYFNGEKGEVTNVTDTEVKVKIPATASSGITSVIVGDQVFFGPDFKVSGKVSFDPEFQVNAGTNSDVYGYHKLLNDERLIFVGAFERYDNQGDITPYRGLVRVFKNGTIDHSFKSGGAGGSISSILQIGDKYVVAGSFSTFYPYNKVRGIDQADNITRLKPDGSLDVTPVTTSTGLVKDVHSFNGGTDKPIYKIFAQNDKIVGIGGFKYYVSHRYNVAKKDIISGSTIIRRDSIVTDSVETRQIARFDINGNLDKTYRFNTILNKGLEGGNGSLSDGYMHSNGSLVLVGNFTKFDSQPAARIVRLDANGIVDPGASFGSGANSFITSITFNETTRKYLLTGAFGVFNGVSVNGMVMLNEDGSIDNSFKAKGLTDGIPTFAKQLSNGLIVVSGSFTTYDNVRRTGLAILSPSGELAPGYNATGVLEGTHDVYESTDSSGKITLTLMGSFTKFNGKNIQNVTRVTLEQ